MLDSAILSLIDTIFSEENLKIIFQYDGIDFDNDYFESFDGEKVNDVFDKINAIIAKCYVGGGFKISLCDDLVKNLQSIFPFSMKKRNMERVIRYQWPLTDIFDKIFINLKNHLINFEILETAANYKRGYINSRELFKTLNMNLTTVERGAQEWNEIASSISNTNRTYEIKIKDIFKVYQPKFEQMFNPDKLDGRKLLFHGTTLDCLPSILAEGLKIGDNRSDNFPNGAIYFTDVFQYAMYYMVPSEKDKLTGYVLLVYEVALGKCNEFEKPWHFQYSETYQSYKRVFYRRDGVSFPEYDFPSYNEYMVENTNQTILRYIVHLDYLRYNCPE